MMSVIVLLNIIQWDISFDIRALDKIITNIHNDNID